MSDLIDGKTMTEINYPYINYILRELNKNKSIEKNFGHHIHWGYWEDPMNARCDDDHDFFLATENLTQKLLSLAKIKDNQSVLDVGCGFGGTISLINNHHSDMQLTGLNIDIRQIDRAKRAIAPSLRNIIDFTQADACHLPFEKNQFDRILAVECIHHFSSRELFFEKAFNILKPGGILTLSDFISSPILLPSCKVLTLPMFKQLNFFGYCNITTLNKYKRLASKYNFEMKLVDITINTIPTYNYLQSLIKKTNFNTFSRINLIKNLLVMKLISSYRLLTYSIISFTKKEVYNRN